MAVKAQPACGQCLSATPTCAGQPFLCPEDAKGFCADVAMAHAATGNGDCTDPTSACYPSYYERRGHSAESLYNACPTNAADMGPLLGKQREVAGEELLFAVVGGLQSFLAERAKAEALSYSVDQLKYRLCTEDYQKYLAKTCELLDAKDLSLDEPTLVRLRTALLEDLDRLPGTMIASLPPTTDPNLVALRLFAQGGGESTLSLARGRSGLVEFPATWAEKNRAAAQANQLGTNCSLLAPSTTMSAGCWSLLLPELGAAVVKREPNADFASDLAAVIEAAAGPFCAAYGPPDQKLGGTCLLGPAGTPSLLKDAASQARKSTKVLIVASLRFVELGKLAKKLREQGTPSHEIAVRLLPELPLAIEAWRAALEEVSPDAAGQRAFATSVFVLQASNAAVIKDYPGLLALVSDALGAGKPLEGLQLPRHVRASLGFAARLAAAKKPEDAKKVFEEEAAPLGSYKVKYDREIVTIAINAFVGPFVGNGWQYHVKQGENDTASGFVARPLSAPLGVDFTLASWRREHLGAMVTLIDPFAVGTVDSDGKAEDFEWGALLTPGAMVRWGVGGSPFTVLAGLTYQPLARSKDDCAVGTSSEPCWKGALQVGGGVAVDVPLFILR